MYLCGSLSSDREYRMAGVLPAGAGMTDRIQALGYVKGTYRDHDGFRADNVPVLGHEFHYSRVSCDRDARFSLILTQGTGIQDGNDGLTEKNTIGSYTHAYFSDTFCRQFVTAAETFRRKGK